MRSDDSGRVRQQAHLPASVCLQAARAAHPDHQQPTGRSAGVFRRRSSRLTGDSPSAGMRGATSASKAAKAEAMMANAPSNGLLLGSCGGAPSTISRQSCRTAHAA